MMDGVLRCELVTVRGSAESVRGVSEKKRKFGLVDRKCHDFSYFPGLK